MRPAALAAIAIVGAVATASLAVKPVKSQEAEAVAASCTALAGQVPDDVTSFSAIFVDRQTIPESPFTGFTGAAPKPVAVGAHCLVRGIIGARTGTDGKSYGTTFELRLPARWNQNFLFQGGGATDGFVAPAVGIIPCRGSTAAPALTRGYAVVSMDGGHPTQDPSFGFDQAARVDFAYASIGKVTRTAKALVRAVYGSGPQLSVFMGCSNGGREAMIAAQRYPLEYDGVIAGNPGFHLSAANLAEAWDTQQLLKIAPRNAQGHPILSKALAQADLDTLSAAVRSSCDDRDGLEDGLINAWRECHFDIKTLLCKPDQTTACLPAAKIEAIDKVFSGPENSAGDALYSTWPYDTGVSDVNWRMWKLGFSDTARPDALNVVLGGASLRAYFLTPPVTKFDPASFDFDKDTHRIAETAKQNDANATYLNSFAGHGGKLIIFQGLSDPVFSANDIVNWYDSVAATSFAGDIEKAREAVRLFMVPGMAHCGDGSALDDFDPLTALEGWIKGNAPTYLEARGKAFPGKRQPICAYPQQAIYRGAGDPNALTSFQCR